MNTRGQRLVQRLILGCLLGGTDAAAACPRPGQDSGPEPDSVLATLSGELVPPSLGQLLDSLRAPPLAALVKQLEHSELVRGGMEPRVLETLEHAESLRAMGDFAGAAEVLGQVLGVLRDLPGITDCERRSMEFLIETTRANAQLPPEARVKLVELERALRTAQDQEARADPQATLITLERSLSELAALGPAGRSTLASAASMYGVELAKSGSAERGTQWCLLAIAAQQSVGGFFGPGKASLLDAVTYCRMQLSDYDGARRLTAASAATQFDCYQGLHPNMLSTLNQVGLLEDKIGNYASASVAFGRLASLYEVAGAPPSDHATVLTDYGRVLGERGRYREAESVLRRALAMFRTALAEEHPLIAWCRRELGAACQRLGKIDEAIEHQRAALQAHVRVLGHEHPWTIDSRGFLAETLLLAGKCEEAEFLLREARDIAVERDGPRNAAVSGLEQALGVLAGMRRDADAARAHFERSLELDVAMFGEDDPRTITSKLNLAKALTADLEPPAQNVARAHGLFRSALAICSREGLANEYEARTDYAQFLRHHLGDYAGAREQYRRAVELVERLRGQATGDEATRAAFTSQLLRWNPYGGMLRSILDGANTEWVAIDMDLVDRARARSLVELLSRDGSFGDSAPSLPNRFPATRPGEVWMCYDVGPDDALLAIARHESGHAGYLYQDGVHVQGRVLASAASTPPGSKEPLEQLGNVLVPMLAREALAKGNIALIVPHGPLHMIAFEALCIGPGDRLWVDSLPPVAYGPSASIIDQKRTNERGGARGVCSLVAAGDAVFRRSDPQPAPSSGSAGPHGGALVVEVVPGSPASSAGLQVGDVIVRYAGDEIEDATALRSAIARFADKRDGALLVATWRAGETVECAVSAGRIGIRVSESPMPRALEEWRSLQLSEDQRTVKHAYATTRDGFGDLLPLPGTRVEVQAIGRIVRKAGAADDAVRILTGDEATLTNLFNAAEKPPRFLHLATHGIVHEGRRVYDSALALAAPENPTPDDFGFLRLQDLLEKWGGRLDGTELVVLSGCQTATGRLEAGDGFVGLTWGFLYAGAESVIASLWKVDDAATALLMTRLYENLLGTYDQPRGWRLDPRTGRISNPPPPASDEASSGDAAQPSTNGDARTARSPVAGNAPPNAGMDAAAQTPTKDAGATRDYGVCPPGTPMPKAEALHEAKRWLRSRTPAENRARLAELGFDVDTLEKDQAQARGRRPSGEPQTLSAPFDYSHPRYWAAFILIGSPD